MAFKCLTPAPTKLSQRPAPRQAQPQSLGLFLSPTAQISLLGLWICAGLTACRTPAPLPAVDTTEPGWTIRQGQASWKPRAQEGELVGEIVVATHTDGRSLVQFFKAPLPLIAAQLHGDHWELRHIPQNRVISGSGPLPSNAIWLHLAAALAGTLPPGPLQFRATNTTQSTLSNPITGETVTVYLNP